MKKNTLVVWGVYGLNTTQLCGEFHKPIKGSLQTRYYLDFRVAGTLRCPKKLVKG